jgi:tetratricopeptide (TPR) repeat protein
MLAALVAALAVTLGTALAPRVDSWTKPGKSDNFFSLMFGDGRKLLANQFFTMADVYFHSGYYPSVFDKNSEEQKDIVTESHGTKESEEDEKNSDFLGKPKDWIDAFGRNFKVTQHTHLDNGNEREILPWLRLAADLDPQKIETYTVGSFFLRNHLNRPDQAEAFLREGLRNNPGNPEILFELGRFYRETGRDPAQVRNVWEMGIKEFLHMDVHAPVDFGVVYTRLDQLSPEQKENRLIYEETAVSLARLEDDTGNYGQAIAWFGSAQRVSLDPGSLNEQIEKIKKKLSATHP